MNLAILYTMTSETETKNAGGSVGNNAIQLNYGQSESNSRIFRYYIS